MDLRAFQHVGLFLEWRLCALVDMQAFARVGRILEWWWILMTDLVGLWAFGLWA